MKQPEKMWLVRRDVEISHGITPDVLKAGPEPVPETILRMRLGPALFHSHTTPSDGALSRKDRAGLPMNDAPIVAVDSPEAEKFLEDAEPEPSSAAKPAKKRSKPKPEEPAPPADEPPVEAPAEGKE